MKKAHVRADESSWPEARVRASGDYNCLSQHMSADRASRDDEPEPRGIWSQTGWQPRSSAFAAQCEILASVHPCQGLGKSECLSLTRKSRPPNNERDMIVIKSLWLVLLSFASPSLEKRGIFYEPQSRSLFAFNSLSGRGHSKYAPGLLLQIKSG